jgi:hypothetical protein
MVPQLRHMPFQRRLFSCQSTVKYYNRHVLCSGQGMASEWIAGAIEKIPDTNMFYATKAIDKLKEIRNDLVFKCSALDIHDSCNDIWILPDQIRFRNVDPQDVNLLLLEYFTGTLSDKYSAESFKEKILILICGHMNRDSRCGHAGKVLLPEFNRLIAEHKLQDKVWVGLTSHIGGHKYAGNVIIYPQGDWFGFINEQNVQQLFFEYILKSHPTSLQNHNWRGRIGL